MHPLVLLIFIAIVILVVIGLVARVRGTGGGDALTDEAQTRRMLWIGLAALLAFNLAMALFGWYVVDNASDAGDDPVLAGEARDELVNRVTALETRVRELETRVAQGDAPPRVAGERIVPALEQVIVRRSPGGEVVTRLAGGTGIDVTYCMERREAGQYWCEIRTPGGDTGWVPRTLIDPPPGLAGTGGG